MSQALVKLELTEKEEEALTKIADKICKCIDEGQKQMWNICYLAHLSFSQYGKEFMPFLSQRIFEQGGHKIHWRRLAYVMAPIYERWTPLLVDREELKYQATQTQLEKMLRVKDDQKALALLQQAVEERWNNSRMEAEIGGFGALQGTKDEVCVFIVKPAKGHIIDCRTILEGLETKGWADNVKKLEKHIRKSKKR